MDDVTPKCWVFNFYVALNKRVSIGGSKEGGYVCWEGGGGSYLWRTRLLRQLFEEKRSWHLQNGCNVLQAARADSVLAVFVFLHLLECDAE